MRLASLLAIAACSKDPAPAPPPPPPPPASNTPLHADSDVHALLADLATAKACDALRGVFLPLRADDRPDVVTGVLWIRACNITAAGTRLTFELSGSGWQWTDQRHRKAGGMFVVRGYTRFDVDIVLPATLDLGYHDHVVSLWISPEHTPTVTFRPLGTIAVDRDGAWSSIVGGAGRVVGQSPEHVARGFAEAYGRALFERQLDDGLAVTVDLCTGLTRFGLGRRPRGTMQPPDAGETASVPVELQPDAVMVFGPELAPHGMSISVATDGVVQASLACRDQAEAVATAVLAGRGNLARPLATATIHGRGGVRVGPQRCPVAVVLRSLAPQPLTLTWQRPAHELAASTGGPLIACHVQ